MLHKFQTAVGEIKIQYLFTGVIESVTCVILIKQSNIFHYKYTQKT